jgi:phosphohistidine phosphatase SixA
MKDRVRRLGRLGNAVVPQIGQWLGERILAFDQDR